MDCEELWTLPGCASCQEVPPAAVASAGSIFGGIVELAGAVCESSSIGVLETSWGGLERDGSGGACLAVFDTC
jgi:hypothetical protein